MDPDQMLQNAASDQGLHSLPLIQQFLDSLTGNKMLGFFLFFFVCFFLFFFCLFFFFSSVLECMIRS